jgi:hypothetical protein
MFVGARRKPHNIGQVIGDMLRELEKEGAIGKDLHRKMTCILEMVLIPGKSSLGPFDSTLTARLLIASVR